MHIPICCVPRVTAAQSESLPQVPVKGQLSLLFELLWDLQLPARLPLLCWLQLPSRMGSCTSVWMCSSRWRVRKSPAEDWVVSPLRSLPFRTTIAPSRPSLLTEWQAWGNRIGHGKLRSRRKSMFAWTWERIWWTQLARRRSTSRRC